MSLILRAISPLLFFLSHPLSAQSIQSSCWQPDVDIFQYVINRARNCVAKPNPEVSCTPYHECWNDGKLLQDFARQGSVPGGGPDPETCGRILSSAAQAVFAKVEADLAVQCAGRSCPAAGWYDTWRASFGDQALPQSLVRCLPKQDQCNRLLVRNPQWLDAEEEEFLLNECSDEMCGRFAAGNYDPDHSSISADQMIKHCMHVLTDLESPDLRSECAQPMPVEERGIAIDEQTVSCRALENERYQSYQRLSGFYNFDQDGNNNKIDDRLEGLLDRIRQLRSDLSRTRDAEEIALNTTVISGGGGLSVTLYAILACLETGPAAPVCLIAAAAGGAFTTVGIAGAVATSNLSISADELRTRLDALEQELANESFSIQRPLNEALTEANMLCTRVQNECM